MVDGFSSTEATPPLPSLALLRDRRPPPALPLELLGKVWAARIEAAAEAKNAPPDYVFAGLLAAASACIGNSQHASPWDGWEEPPFLWLAVVGNPSSGKSPGIGAVISDVLPTLEDELTSDFSERQLHWESERIQAQIIQEEWEANVIQATLNKNPPPPMPATAIVPPKPIRPRIVANDPTIEAVAALLSTMPRGMLLYRDELAAFIGSFDRYTNGRGGSDRASWLEAWNAARKVIDRKQNPDPIIVPRFGLSILGGLQPDRLIDLIRGQNDGLAVRFLWVFPASRPFARPSLSHDPKPWVTDLRRLLRLQMQKDEGGADGPLTVHFSPTAMVVIEKYARQWAAREARQSGLLLGALGKARGQMARLALVLELLRWSAEKPEGEPPTEVGEECTTAAAELMETYFLPMAERAFRSEDLTPAERNARTLLRHIIATGASTVNERAIRETPGLQGLTTAKTVREAVEALQREEVLLPMPQVITAGRPRADHRVNPRLTEAIKGAPMSKQSGVEVADLVTAHDEYD
jgi:hypothetical protein